MPTNVRLLAAVFLALCPLAGLEAQAAIIAPGQAIRGELTSSDATRGGGNSYQDVYLIQGEAGDRYELSLTSSSFDTYLLFGRSVGSDFSSISTNDDGGDGTDARLIATIPSNGLYQILASSFAGGVTGSYRLEVRDLGPAPEPELRTITAGEIRQGRLGTSDAMLDNGAFYDLYRFQGRAGERVRIDLEADFDTYLELGRGGSAGSFSEIESDDDGGDGLDSQITTTLPSSGSYLIRARSLGSGRTGAYTVRLASLSGGGPSYPQIYTGERRVGSLGSGDRRLDDDSYFDDYLFEGRRGQTITIDLRSDDFDAYLGLGRLSNGSFSMLESDDDGGSGLDSRIRYTLPSTGTYVIRANSLSGGATGRYTIEVRN